MFHPRSGLNRVADVKRLVTESPNGLVKHEERTVREQYTDVCMYVCMCMLVYVYVCVYVSSDTNL